MASKFLPGAKAYARDGRVYMIEIVDGGTVYCKSANGAETDFPETALMTESEWGSRTDGHRDAAHTRLKQDRAYTSAPVKVDPAACAALLNKVDHLTLGLLDFTAFTVAANILTTQGDPDMVAELSIKKCRALFDAAKPDVRVNLLAGVLSTPPDTLLGAAKLGDNMARAMIEKGLAGHGEAFEEFIDRPRR
jgi:hypothetical protein